MITSRNGPARSGSGWVFRKLKLLERIEYQGNRLEGASKPCILSQIDFSDGTRSQYRDQGSTEFLRPLPGSPFAHGDHIPETALCCPAGMFRVLNRCSRLLPSWLPAGSGSRRPPTPDPRGRLGYRAFRGLPS